MSCSAGQLTINCNVYPFLMRRLDPGAANERPRNVARNLFGPVDHDETGRRLAEELRRISEDDRRNWNFDFQAETPLPGRFEWQPVNGDANTADDDGGGMPPLRHPAQPVQAPVVAERTRIEPAGSAALVVPTRGLSLSAPESSASREEAVHDAALDEPTTASSSKNVRQTTMTEFMPQRKRTLSTETPSLTNKMAAGEVASMPEAKKAKKSP